MLIRNTVLRNSRPYILSSKALNSIEEPDFGRTGGFCDVSLKGIWPPVLEHSPA
jgi:hypothetical protein